MLKELIYLFDHDSSKVRKQLVLLLAECRWARGQDAFEMAFGNSLSEGKRKLINVYFERRNQEKSSITMVPRRTRGARSRKGS